MSNLNLNNTEFINRVNNRWLEVQGNNPMCLVLVAEQGNFFAFGDDAVATKMALGDDVDWYDADSMLAVINADKMLALFKKLQYETKDTCRGVVLAA